MQNLVKRAFSGVILFYAFGGPFFWTIFGRVHPHDPYLMYKAHPVAAALVGILLIGLYFYTLTKSLKDVQVTNLSKFAIAVLSIFFSPGAIISLSIIRNKNKQLKTKALLFDIAFCLIGFYLACYSIWLMPESFAIPKIIKNLASTVTLYPLIFCYLLALCVFVSPVSFSGAFLLLLISIAMLIEWIEMTNKRHMIVGASISLLPFISLMVLLFHSGRLFCVLPKVSDLWLVIFNSSWKFILYYFCMLWSVDVFAFVGGKTVKGPKLAPKISPNKTYSGLICAIIACCFCLYLILNNLETNVVFETSSGFTSKVRIGTEFTKSFVTSPLFSAVIGTIFALLAQTGDLLISFYKRKFNIKDTGNLIPGHGGALDRFDGMILTAPFFTCLVLLLPFTKLA